MGVNEFYRKTSLKVERHKRHVEVRLRFPWPRKPLTPEQRLNISRGQIVGRMKRMGTYPYDKT